MLLKNLDKNLIENHSLIDHYENSIKKIKNQKLNINS